MTPKYLLLALLSSLLTSCGGYPRLLNSAFDSGGRSLNSPAAELEPIIAANYIVFVSDRGGSQDIYLYNTTQKKLVDLPGLNSLDAIASHPSVSEDGRYIVFTASRQGRRGVYLYDRETTQSRNLTTKLAAEVRNPSISADGSTIAFEASTDGQWDILVYESSGKRLE
ncbi:MAG: Tol biopolymer transporter periplasmic protein [Spirulinaceae cyanobacterium]